jgi:hypothetical protein
MRSGFTIMGRRTAPRRGATARFLLVLALLVVIVCGSFGGVAYAATGAGARTSADDQYGNEGAVTPKVKSSSAAQSQARGQGGTLPFTGLSLAGTAVLGLALVGAGVALRRRERRD